MCSDNVRSTASGFHPLLEIDMALDGFQRDWNSCDLVAAYLAECISDGRGDTLRRINLMSSVLNELFETVFRSGNGEGNISCRIARNDVCHRIELSFGCVPAHRELYKVALSASRETVLATYMAGLLEQTAPGPAERLSGLGVNFGARMSPMPVAADMIGIVVDLPFDGAEH